jgi:hypothetical protein
VFYGNPPTAETSARTWIHRTDLAVPLQWLNENMRGWLKLPALDHGCGGDAYNAKWFQQQGVPVMAYDRLQPAWKVMPGNKGFKTIFSTYVLNTRSQKDSQTIVREIQGLLKPDGLAYIAVRNHIKDTRTQRFTTLSAVPLRDCYDYILYRIGKRDRVKVY